MGLTPSDMKIPDLMMMPMVDLASSSNLGFSFRKELIPLWIASSDMKIPDLMMMPMVDSWHGLANHWAPNVQMTAFIYSPVNQLSHNNNKGSLLASLLGLAKVIHPKYYRNFTCSQIQSHLGR